MPLSSRDHFLVFHLVSFEVDLPLHSLRSLSLVSRTVCRATRARLFRKVCQLDVCDAFRDGTLARRLLPPLHNARDVRDAHDAHDGWSHRFDVR